MIQKIFLFIYVLFVLTYSFNGVEAQCENSYFAEAFNLRSTVGPDTVQFPDPAAQIPPSGGDDVETPAPINIPFLIEAQTLRSEAHGGGDQSSALASIGTVTILPDLVPAAIVVDTVQSMVTADCPSGTATGSTTITELTILGNEFVLPNPIPANYDDIPPIVTGLLTIDIILNEQIETANGLTVNAIHLFITPNVGLSTELIINSATAGITCCTNAPVLSLKKSHKGNFVVGERGIYTLTVGNKGADSTSGEIKVVDTLPDGLTFVSAKGKGWTAEADGQKVTLTTTKSIASGDTSTIQLVVDVTKEAFPRVTNVARASGGGVSNRPVARDRTRVFLTSLHFTGKQLSNEFATQTEYINRLKWKESPTDSVVAYLLFRNGRPIARIPNHGHSFHFDDHNRREDERDTYKIIAVDQDGAQSEVEVIKVP